MTTRYTVWPVLPGIVSPGVATFSALARVVVTAMIEAGLASPLSLASRSIMVLSRWAAAAGIAEPAVTLAADDNVAKAAATAPATTTAADTYLTALRCRDTHRGALSDTSALLKSHPTVPRIAVAHNFSSAPATSGTA